MMSGARWTVVAAGLLLAGCLPGPTREALMHQTRKDWQSFKSTDWVGTARAVTGLKDAAPTYDERWQTMEKQLCAGSHGRNRVTVQDGVNDAISYRQCPFAPGDPALGQRLAPRNL